MVPSVPAKEVIICSDLGGLHVVKLLAFTTSSTTHRLHVCDRLEVFEFHVLKPCRMYDEGFFYQSGYCVKTFVSY